MCIIEIMCVIKYFFKNMNMKDLGFIENNVSYFWIFDGYNFFFNLIDDILLFCIIS